MVNWFLTKLLILFTKERIIILTNGVGTSGYTNGKITNMKWMKILNIWARNITLQGKKGENFVRKVRQKYLKT